MVTPIAFLGKMKLGVFVNLGSMFVGLKELKVRKSHRGISNNLGLSVVGVSTLTCQIFLLTIK